MSPQKDHQKPPLKAAILPPLCRLPLGPRLWLRFQFQVLSKSCANSSWRLMQLPSSCWNRIIGLALANSLSKLGFPISIMGTCIWTATVSASSVRITSRLLGPADPTASYLPLCSSVGQWYSISIYINVALRLVKFQWHRPNLKTSSERT